MEKIILLPIIDGNNLDEIDMGEGKQDMLYKEEVVFYKSGYIIVGNKAEYSYSIRLVRNLREGEHQG